MKKIVMIWMVIALIATVTTRSQARDRSVEGLIIGGGTGAIVGQAVGHTAQSTIIGATVGGAVGLIAGSGIDSHHRQVVGHGQRVFSYSGGKYHPHRRPVYREVICYDDHRAPVYRDGYKNKKRHHKRHHFSRPVFSNPYKGDRINKRHHKSRPVFSNPYRGDRRHHGKECRSNHHHYRF